MEVPLFLCCPSSKLCGKILLAIILSIEKTRFNYMKKLNLFLRGGEGEGFSKNGNKGV